MSKFKRVGETEAGEPIYVKVEQDGSSGNSIAIIGLISAILGLITAIVGFVGAIPVGTDEEPLACSINSSIIRGIYACNTTINIHQPITSTPHTQTPAPLTLPPIPTLAPSPTYTSLPTITSIPTNIPTITSTPTKSETNTLVPSSTPSHTPTATVTPSTSPSPTTTPQIPTATFTASTSIERFYLLSLENARFWPDGYNIGLEVEPGTVEKRELKGIPFEIGRQLDSLGCSRGTSNTFVVPSDVESPQTVYFLIQAGNGYSRYYGEQLGRLTLTFEDNSVVTMNLVLGENIRDWALDDVAVNTVTSPYTIEAWQGLPQDSDRWGRMDIIIFEIPLAYQNENLRVVSIEDTNEGEPCIHLQAITVEKSGSN